jgi:hypothetical protein
VTDLADALQRLSPGEDASGDRPSDAPGLLTISNEDLEQLWFGLMPDTYAGRRGLDSFSTPYRQAPGRRQTQSCNSGPAAGR